MRLYCYAWSVAIFCSSFAIAQDTTDTPVPAVTLHVGDPAPPLYLKTWLKGKPVTQFEKGRVYVLEFWSPGCKPCIASMPHMSALAAQYRDQVTVIAIDVHEFPSTTTERIQQFVDKMGDRMDFPVAKEDSNFMDKAWLTASGGRGIPKSMVIDREGQLAWIGKPWKLDQVLEAVVNNTWDLAKAAEEHNTHMLLDSLDYEAHYSVIAYRDRNRLDDSTRMPHIALWLIDEIVQKEPRLRYATGIAYETFAALLQTDPSKAYVYGKAAIASKNFAERNYEMITDVIDYYSGTVAIPPPVYELGAEAALLLLETFPYPEILNRSYRYHQIASFYARANNKKKAVEAMQKAIAFMKEKTDHTDLDLQAYNDTLKKYRRL